MKSPDTCSTCGSPLPDGVSEKQCPACLLRAGMQAETVPSDVADHPDSMADAETTAAPREALGTMIGRYKLLQEIGEGGFGIVYLAEQREPVKRKVALKVLKPGMDTREVVARFEAERQALALMDHPNIAQVFDGGATESGRPYFVMELVKGMPLTKYCDDHQLNTRQRLDLFLDVLAAVQHAHQKGIIHRDLKPSNILASPHDGVPVVKVIDFGIAKAVSMELTEKTLFTGYGKMIGTPQYMSPEQAETNALDVDTRSDLYSLGVVLYELLTGRTPLDAKRLRSAGYAEIQRLVREEEPPKPSTRISTLGAALADVARRHGTEPVKLGKQVRGDLDWIVMKALEKDRTRRYETANAFAVDLRRHLADEPVEAGPPSTTYRLKKLLRRNRVKALAFAAVLSVFTTGICGVFWNMRAEQKASEQAQKASEEAQKSARSAISEWAALMSQVAALLMSNKPERRFEAFEALRRAGSIEAVRDLRSSVVTMRNAVIACLAIVDMRTVDSWQSGQPPGALISPGPGMSSYACASPDGQISVFSYPGRTLLSALPGEGQPVNRVLRFSPNGALVAAGYGDGPAWKLKLWSIRSGIRSIEAGTGLSKAFDFFPDSRHCVVGRPVGDNALLDVVDAETGTSVRQFALSGIPHSLAVSSDGKQIAISLMEDANTKDQPGQVQVLDAESGKVVAVLAAAKPRALAWSPFDESLAVCSGDTLLVWPPKRWTTAPVELRGHIDVVDAVAWSPDGRLLASAAWDDTTKLWDPFQGKVHASHFGRGSMLGFSADGTRLGILSQGEKLAVLEVAPGDVCYRGRGHNGIGGGTVGAFQGVWNAAGSLMATSGDDGVRLWNRDGRNLAILKLPRSRGLGFLPDSLLVASASGISRWRMKTETAGPEITVTFEKPEVIGDFQSCAQLALSPDNGLMAVAGRQLNYSVNQLNPSHEDTGIWLVDLKSDAAPHHLERSRAFAYCAISPDGRWLAAGTWTGNGVRIWPLPGVTTPVELPIHGSATVAFSPDGRWLVTGELESCRFWKIGSWELARTIPSEMGGYPGVMAFSPRKIAIAIACRRSEVKVLNPVTLEEIATLDFEQESPLCFDPSGVLMVNSGPRGIFFWRMDIVRSELGKMGLDWITFPSFPATVIPAVSRVILPAPGE